MMPLLAAFLRDHHFLRDHQDHRFKRVVLSILNCLEPAFDIDGIECDKLLHLLGPVDTGTLDWIARIGSRGNSRLERKDQAPEVLAAIEENISATQNNE